MTLLHRIICILITLFLASPLISFKTLGQSISGSAYTVFGIGDLLPRQSALNLGLGGGGIGIRNGFFINLQNPASYTAINSPISQIFEMGAFVEANKYNTSNSNATNANGGLGNLNFWFRFSPKWAVTFGLAPYSKVDFDIKEERRLGAFQDESTINYIGEGGFNQAYFGNAFQLSKNLSIGINAAYIFGSILKTEIVESSALSSGFWVENRLFMNKIQFDFGTQYSLFLDKAVLIFGATFTNKTSISIENEATLFETDLDTIAGELTTENNHDLPLTIGFGIAMQRAKSTLSADIKYQNWSSTSFNEGNELRDTFHYTLGYEFKTNFTNEHNLNLTSFRTGLFYKDNYLLLDSKSFAEWGFNAGFGIPIQGNKATINFNYTFHKRGTTSNELIEETANHFNLVFVFRDIWFTKRAYY